MTNDKKEYKKLIDEFDLVRVALEETENTQSITKDLLEKERLERRILDYERHLRLLTSKIEFYENKVG